MLCSSFCIQFATNPFSHSKTSEKQMKVYFSFDKEVKQILAACHQFDPIPQLLPLPKHYKLILHWLRKRKRKKRNWKTSNIWVLWLNLSGAYPMVTKFGLDCLSWLLPQNYAYRANFSLRLQFYFLLALILPSHFLIQILQKYPVWLSPSGAAVGLHANTEVLHSAAVSAGFHYKA